MAGDRPARVMAGRLSGRVEVWSRDRADALAALVDAAMPDEKLTADELLACCWDDPGVVLGLPGGEAAAVAVCRPWGERPEGIVKLLVVAPAAQGEGRGRLLLDAAHEWAYDQGAGTMHMGRSVPFYLWPGVDVRFTRMLSLAESAGYVPDGAALNMSFPASFRAGAPAGLTVRRVLEDADADAVLDLCGREWPHWVDEARRGIEQGACHAAVDEATGSIVAFVCHSVNRAGWLGPMATHPDARRRGTGRALLAAVAADLRVAGLAHVEVAWVGPIGFYARAAGAVVSRVFRTVHLRTR